MAEVDFLDFKASKAWFETQSPQMRSAVASRAALRVLANISRFEADTFKILALLSFRTVLISAVRGSGRTADMEVAARSAADSALSAAARSAARTPANTAVSAAARSAADSAAYSAHSAYYALSAAARSAADSAAACSALKMDAERPLEHQMLGILWPLGGIPPAITDNFDSFLSILDGDPDWAFWRVWYKALWDGTFEDWDLAHEVAKIENEFWEGEDALAKVAAEIERIKVEFGRNLPRPENVPELERSALLQHVKRLLSSSDMTALAAEGAADTLRRAIKEYLNAAPANCLPDQLAHLENLPALFEGISKTVKNTDLAEANEKRLADQIEALNEEVAKLEAGLKLARSKTVNGLFTQSAIKAAGTAFGAGVVGSLGLGLAHFFGQWPDDFTLENLRGFLSDLDTATPKLENAPTLPSALDT